MDSFTTLMASGGWAVSALIAAVFTACIFTLNQYIKQPGYLLVFFSRITTVICMTPFMGLIPWPENPWFYAIVATTAFFGASGDIRTFNVSAQYGGGVVSRTMPLVIFFSFFLWFFIDHALFWKYLEHPLNTAGIIASLLGVGYFSSRIKKCTISKSAFFAMLPALLCYTLTILLNKYSMGMGEYSGVVFGYMYVQSVAAIFTTGGYALWRRRKEKAKIHNRKKLLWGAVAFSLLWIASMTFQGYTLVFTPNPSYLFAIAQLSSVMIAVFYHFTGHKEEADVKAGFGITACAILLILMSV